MSPFPHPPGLYACKEGRNSPCLVYVTFNQKIYVYWEVQLERMESTNLLKLLEAEPEYQSLLLELGVGESQESQGVPGTETTPASHQPPSHPQILTTSLRSVPCFTKRSTTLTGPCCVLPPACRTPPSWTRLPS